MVLSLYLVLRFGSPKLDLCRARLPSFHRCSRASRLMLRMLSMVLRKNSIKKFCISLSNAWIILCSNWNSSTILHWNVGWIWAVRKRTGDYTAEMARVSTTYSLKEGIIFLWAMEKVGKAGSIFWPHLLTPLLLQVYFDAWSYVKTLQQKTRHIALLQ